MQSSGPPGSSDSEGGGALLRELKQVVPATLGQAGRSLGAGGVVSEMMCMEGPATRESTHMYARMHRHAHVHTCMYTHTHTRASSLLLEMMVTQLFPRAFN